ncbi:hypothetical protein [Mesorhizobium australafricanum]|uniref:Uncharacterized protein n=1 Tax=Mesorhizobium australafricanum TaxID=3072311 RepID=A0ABU4X2R3_9HYPH|nr:hypothetical protein [Mesorhizobium sp. VK3E]MDX8441369.1 hypothetical protein [Mesorhizobium sp. VK3E]
MKLSFCYGNIDLVSIRLASTWVRHQLRHPHLETSSNARELNFREADESSTDPVRQSAFGSVVMLCSSEERHDAVVQQLSRRDRLCVGAGQEARRTHFFIVHLC